MRLRLRLRLSLRFPFVNTREFDSQLLLLLDVLFSTEFGAALFLSHEPAEVLVCSAAGSAVEETRTTRRRGEREVEEVDAINVDDIKGNDCSLRGQGGPILMLATCARTERVVSGALRAGAEREARISVRGEVKERTQKGVTPCSSSSRVFS